MIGQAAEEDYGSISGILRITSDGIMALDVAKEKLTPSVEARVLRELMKIRGVGEELAKRMIAAGIRTARQAASASWVPKGVRLCAEYAEDLDAGMDRHLADVLYHHINLVIMQSGDMSGEVVKLIPVGSFRRGHAHLKDLDLLLVVKDAAKGEARSEESISEELSAVIEKRDRFIGRVSMGPSSYEFLYSASSVGSARSRTTDRERSNGSPHTHHRASGRSDTARMVEVYIAPEREMGAALLHTTGPKEYNILLRRKAKSMGMLLSQHGLFRGSELVAARTEKEILSVLRVEYAEPTMRDSHDVWRQITPKRGRGSAESSEGSESE